MSHEYTFRLKGSTARNPSQGKGWNPRDRKDQCEILWLIRKKRPKLVIGCGKCILFCMVLYPEQIRRGAWFLHEQGSA